MYSGMFRVLLNLSWMFKRKHYYFKSYNLGIKRAAPLRRSCASERHTHSPLLFHASQAASVFMMSCCSLLTLVLEEDGTVVDSEDFFQSLPSSTPLMVLDAGEMWSHSKVRTAACGPEPLKPNTSRWCSPGLQGAKL
uniref:CIDE-N domain-containing protein n=1 Tax=Fundulus heteroclitus TaxID=8078 RepID=A0A3Q2PF22_FUNHE